MPLSKVQPVALANSGAELGYRNRIINGDMRIFQRGVAATADITYSVDRWRLGKSNDATESVTQSTDAPPGFTHSIRNTVGTADTSIGALQYSNLKHAIEAPNIADFAFGTANAKPVTLSFWVKSSVAGLYSGNICSYDEQRICPYTYTISAANTWEYKTITLPGDTTGTWATAVGVGGLSLYFYMALGSNYYNGTAGVWGAPPNYGAGGASHANVLATTGNIFAITGVQLEKGSTATSFEYRPYGQELALCQRYFVKEIDHNTMYAAVLAGPAAPREYFMQVRLPVPMRAAPTVTTSELDLHKPGIRYDAITAKAVNAGNSVRGFYLSYTAATNDPTAYIGQPRDFTYSASAEL